MILDWSLDSFRPGPGCLGDSPGNSIPSIGTQRGLESELLIVQCLGFPQLCLLDGISVDTPGRVWRGAGLEKAQGAWEKGLEPGVSVEAGLCPCPLAPCWCTSLVHPATPELSMFCCSYHQGGLTMLQFLQAVLTTYQNQRGQLREAKFYLQSHQRGIWTILQWPYQ